MVGTFLLLAQQPSVLAIIVCVTRNLLIINMFLRFFEASFRWRIYPRILILQVVFNGGTGPCSEIKLSNGVLPPNCLKVLSIYMANHKSVFAHQMPRSVEPW